MATTSTSTQQHREMATEEGPVAVAIVTVSDTRTPETDKNAVFLRQQLAAEGNSVAAYQIIKDEPDQVAAVLDKMAETEAQVILFNGGTASHHATRLMIFSIASWKRLFRDLGNSFGCLATIRSVQQQCFQEQRLAFTVERSLSLRRGQPLPCNWRGKS